MEGKGSVYQDPGLGCQEWLDQGVSGEHVQLSFIGSKECGDMPRPRDSGLACISVSGRGVLEIS